MPEAIDFFYNCNNLSNKIGKKNDNEGIKWAKEFIKTIYYAFDKIYFEKRIISINFMKITMQCNLNSGKIIINE